MFVHVFFVTLFRWNFNVYPTYFCCQDTFNFFTSFIYGFRTRSNILVIELLFCFVDVILDAQEMQTFFSSLVFVEIQSCNKLQSIKCSDSGENYFKNNIILLSVTLI